MEKYELYYLGILIGKLEILNNEYKYVVINKHNDIFYFLNEDSFGNLKDFPFMESRVKNMKKFNLSNLKYQNSNYELIKIK
jgi:hypothetical protein